MSVEQHSDDGLHNSLFTSGDYTPNLQLVTDVDAVSSLDAAVSTPAYPDRVFDALRQVDIPYTIARLIACKITPQEDGSFPETETLGEQFSLQDDQVDDYLRRGAQSIEAAGLPSDIEANLLVGFIRGHVAHPYPEFQPTTPDEQVTPEVVVGTEADELDVSIPPAEQVPARPGVVKTRREAEATVQHLDITRLYLNQIGSIELLNAEQEVELAKKIEVGVFAQERIDRAQAGKTAPLSVQDYKDLRTLAKQGECAYQEFYAANLRLVVSYAKQKTGRGLSLLDLIQEGNDGLNKAVQMFDYTLGYKFSTYANNWIRQSITRGLHNMARPIRLPVNMSEALGTLKGTRNRLQLSLGRSPTFEEIAIESGHTPALVQELLALEAMPFSLDADAWQDSTTPVGETIVEDVDGVEDRVVENVMVDTLHRVVEELSPLQASIVRRHHGLTGINPQSFEQIARELNRTPAHVRLLYMRALAELRQRPELEGSL